MSKDRVEQLIKARTIKTMKSNYLEQFSGFLITAASIKAKELMKDHDVFSFRKTNEILASVDEYLQLAINQLQRTRG